MSLALFHYPVKYRHRSEELRESETELRYRFVIRAESSMKSRFGANSDESSEGIGDHSKFVS